MALVSKDVLWDIFSRLPIKSIIRCKCVCQYWRSLLQNPSFVQIHLNRCSQNKYISNIYILPDRGTSPNALALLDLDADIDHSDPSSLIAAATPAKIGQNLNDPHSHDYFSPYICVCNGLVCFSEYPIYYPKLVCNPVTGQSISLPPSPTKLRRQKIVASGIGFDQVTGQYKVVQILNREPDPEFASRMGAEIYTLEGNGSWREVGEVPSLRHIWETMGLFVDGELHWRIYYGNTPSILCMDIGREKFYTVQLPEMLSLASAIIDWKGCLGIVENHPYGDNRFTNIWVLKDHHPSEEGKKKMSTWTKDIIIEWDLSLQSRQLVFINLEMPDYGYPLDFLPLGVQKNGEILVLCHACILGSYNLENRQFTIIEVGWPLLCIGANKSVAHIASFVSL